MPFLMRPLGPSFFPRLLFLTQTGDVNSSRRFAQQVGALSASASSSLEVCTASECIVCECIVFSGSAPAVGGESRSNSRSSSRSSCVSARSTNFSAVHAPPLVADVAHTLPSVVSAAAIQPSSFSALHAKSSGGGSFSATAILTLSFEVRLGVYASPDDFVQG